MILPATTAGVSVLLAVLLWLMPDLTRRDLYFAVTVQGSLRDEPAGIAIRRRYRNELVLVSLAALALIASSLLWINPRFAPAVLYLQVAATFVVFYRARSRVLLYAVRPTTIREVELRERPAIVPGGLFVAAGPFVILAFCAAYLLLHGNAIPRGSSVYLLNAAATLATLSLVLYGLAHWLRPVYSGGAQGAREVRFRRTCALTIVTLEYYIALQLSWAALTPFRPEVSLAYRLVTVLVPLLIVTISLIALARMGQGGGASSASGAVVGDRTPDRDWIWGTFYVNRNDPAIFIERRFGLGYTLNFGRPGAWLILGSSLLGMVVVALLAIAKRG
jgi:uncharacterized membrane protein